MGLFSRSTPAETAMAKANQLTPDEARQLARLEATVQSAVPHTLTMVEAGKALATIRDRQLYRATASSFDDYVHARFGMTRRRADQLIAFAGIQDAAGELRTAVLDLSERSLRPLAGMEPAEVQATISEAAADPAGVTPATIRKAASRRKKPKAAKAPRPWRQKVPCALVVVTLGRKAAAAGVDIEAALLAALDAHRRGRGDRAGEAA